MLKALIGEGLDPLLQETSRFVQRLGLRPNTLTFIGVRLNGLAA